jgi:phenylacetate-coenzyme A ligase PaaK-like adenylate-forming protein
MRDLTSPGGDLEPIERATAGELRALQLERLRWTLRHAYANVPHYRAAFDAAGVHPDDCKDLSEVIGPGVAQECVETKDGLHIWEDHRPGTAAPDAAEAGATLAARVKNTIGVTVTTSVEAPGTIERSMGKMRRIVDHRPR